MTNTTNTQRTNRYAATCFECSGRVTANQGSLEKFDGRWIVRHMACARNAAAIDAVLEGPASICSRHGETLDDDGCWECNVEADIVAQELAGDRAAAAAKHARDNACQGGTCHDINRMCSKHSWEYQRHFGRAAND